MRLDLVPGRCEKMDIGLRTQARERIFLMFVLCNQLLPGRVLEDLETALVFVADRSRGRVLVLYLGRVCTRRPLHNRAGQQLLQSLHLKPAVAALLHEQEGNAARFGQPFLQHGGKRLLLGREIQAVGRNHDVWGRNCCSCTRDRLTCGVF